MRGLHLGLFVILLAAACGASGAVAPQSATGEVSASFVLTLQLRDADGAPCEARVSVTERETGEACWPEDLSIPTYRAYSGHKYFYARNIVRVLVPPGWVHVVISRGPEWNVVESDLYIARDLRWRATLTRRFDAAAFGWYGGDTHVHIAHGGDGSVYTITNEDLALAARAEGLHVICALSNGLYFNGGLDPAGDADHLVHFGVEYRSALYGHIGLIGLQSLPSSFGCCLPGYPAVPLNLEIERSAHEQGALVSCAHPVTMDPALMTNAPLDWPYSGFAREAPVDVMAGELDVYDLYSYSNESTAEARDLWFDLLNLGQALPVSAGTDGSLDRWFDPPPGGYRVYVKVDGPLTFAAWREGLRRGHSFATNGPVITGFSVEGVSPGDTLTLPAAASGPLHGTLHLLSRSPMSRLEIYVRGERTCVCSLPAYETALDYSFTFATPTVPGWIVARVVGDPASPADVGNPLEATTSPITIQVDGATMSTEPAAAARFVPWIEKLETLVLERDGWESTRQAALVWNVLEDARLRLVQAGSRTREGWNRDRMRAATADREPAKVERENDTVRSPARVEFFDVSGRKVYSGWVRDLPAGSTWNALAHRVLSARPGVYFCRIQAPGRKAVTRRVLLLR